MKIIVASNIQGFAKSIADRGYDVVSEVSSTSELQRLFGSTESIGDILIATEKMDIQTSLIPLLLDIHEHFPEVRIIFFATGDLTNKFNVNQLKMLAGHGIYDLFYEGKITGDKIKYLIEHPKMKIDCREIFEAAEAFEKEQTYHSPEEEKEFERFGTIHDDVVRNNIIAVTSVKPGTGKSFISSNLAVTLAKYGRPNKDGEKPTILLLEGDLQTLSVTTLFGIKDDEYNLRTALAKIDEFFAKHDGNPAAWFEGAEDVKSFIRRCCLRTKIDNLFILEGHDFDFDDVAMCDGSSYYYLTDYLATQFDEVVIDSNSSLQHPTTDPIFQLSKSLFFVYTTEFNNIKLNLRYMEDLNALGITKKIKYILNKALIGEQKATYTFKYSDKDIIGDKIKTDFEIPLVDMAVILNSTYRHIQLAMDNTFKTLPVRISFLELGDSVIPLRAPEDMEAEIKQLEKKYKRKK